MAVLITVIPQSEREWVQWIGRTARNDRRGQYAVILNRENDLISANMASLREFKMEASSRAPPKYRKDVIGKLLELSDKKVGERIDSHNKEVQDGIRANCLCDAFYTTGGADAVLQEDHFPANAKQQALINFLDANKFSANKVREAALALGVTLPERIYV